MRRVSECNQPLSTHYHALYQYNLVLYTVDPYRRRYAVLIVYRSITLSVTGEMNCACDLHWLSEAKLLVLLDQLHYASVLPLCICMYVFFKKYIY